MWFVSDPTNLKVYRQTEKFILQRQKYLDFHQRAFLSEVACSATIACFCSTMMTVLEMMFDRFLLMFIIPTMFIVFEDLQEKLRSVLKENTDG